MVEISGKDPRYVWRHQNRSSGSIVLDYTQSGSAKKGSESGRMKDFFDSSKSIDFRHQRSRKIIDREIVLNLFRIHG